MPVKNNNQQKQPPETPKNKQQQQQKPPPPMAAGSNNAHQNSNIPMPTKKSINVKRPTGEKGQDKKASGDLPVFKPDVGYNSQNTAMLAGQSLTTNTMQNLLVGRKGEHIDNVQQLFNEFFTDPAVMSRMPRQHQNDAVHRQLGSFQRIVDEMEAHFAFTPSKLHGVLITIVSTSPQIKNNLRLGKLKEIFEQQINDAQKVTGFLRDNDRKSKQFFENFLSEIQYHKRLRQYFCHRIYCALYLYYYDEFDDAAKTDDDYAQEVEALASKTSRANKSRTKGQGDLPEGDRILNKKEYLIGNYKAVSNWSERRKLSYAVEHLFHLTKRWEALVDDNGVLSADDFEPESSENMDALTSYPAFESILRLMPDLYVKTRKAVELAILWWTAGNKLLPANPDQMIERQEVLERIGDIQAHVGRLTDELATADMRTLPYQHDLDALLSRDDRFNRLAADYEYLAALKREKVDRHQKLEDRINELESDSPYWSRRRAAKTQREPAAAADFIEEVQRTHQQMEKSFRSLRLVAYQFEITSGDYLAELTVRPTFVRFLDTCQQRLTLSEGEISQKRSELSRAQRELRDLMENYSRRRDVLEKYMSVNDGPLVGNRLPAVERLPDNKAESNEKPQGKNAKNPVGSLDLRKISPPQSHRNVQQNGQQKANNNKANKS